MNTKSPTKWSKKRNLVAIAAIGVVILLALDLGMNRRFRAQQQASRDLAAQQFKQNLEDFFSVRFGALLALKSFYESSNQVDSGQFKRFSAGLLKDIPYYRAIAFADFNYFIREIYPLQGNEGLEGLSLKQPEEVYEPLRRAIKDKRLTITSAVNLRNVGLGLMANLAVFRKDRLQGVVVGIFDFNEIMEKSVSPSAREQFYFRLLDRDGRILHVGPGEFPKEYSEAEVKIGNTSWNLMFAFKNLAIPGMAASRRILWIFGLIILVSLITFLRLLEQKNDTLASINAQLKVANIRIKDFETKKQEIILQRMTDGVVVVDGDLRVTMANPAATSILGTGNRHAFKVGERVHPYLEPFDLSIPVETIFYARDPISFELTLKEADTVVFSARATSLVDSDENRVGTVLTFRNITAAKRLEKLKAEFIGQISHKLNTPLTVIQGNLALLEEGVLGPMNEKQASQIKKAQAKGKELAALVRRLLDFTQIENRTLKMDLKKEDCYIEDVINEALQELEPELKDKKVSLERTIMSGLTMKGADRERLKGMMIQLLENAVRFNPPGTRVRLATSLTNGSMTISVSDNGVGIAKEEQPLIFEPFHQVDGEFTGNVRGAGLGLSIAKQIAKAHGGDIAVDSTLKIGSTFKVTLPYR